MSRQLLFSVGMKDFEMQTFSVGGPGGGGKDTSNSGVRLTHPPSGAVGEGRSARSNTHNRKEAFKHLIATIKFKSWHKTECARRMGQTLIKTPEQIMVYVDELIVQGMLNGDIVIE